jgi:predicted small secreted protein
MPTSTVLRRKRALLPIAVVLLAVVLSGCSLVKGAVEMQQDIEALGVTDVSVNHNVTNGTATLQIGYTSAKTDEQSVGQETGQIQRTAWTKYPAAFDVMELTVRAPQAGPGGSGVVTATRAELEEAFGPRPAELDESPAGEILGGLAIFGLVVLLFIILAIVLIVVLVRRSRRKKREQYGGGQGPQGPYGPGPGGGGGWGGPPQGGPPQGPPPGGGGYPPPGPGGGYGPPGGGGPSY